MKTTCAKLDETNTVVKLIIVSTNTTESWCSEKFGGVWAKCPVDANPPITLGFTYDSTTQTFSPPTGEANG